MPTKNQPTTIILTGGGSGGHITPLLPLAHALKNKQPCRVIYIGIKGDKIEGLQNRYQVFDEVRTVSAGKFRRYHSQSYLAHLIDIKTLALNFVDFFKVLAGIVSSRKILKQLKPDVVFSKGGFGAVPVGVAAHQLGIPIVTHDSDSLPGLANRIIGRWAMVHATAVPDKVSPYPAESVKVVGIPLGEHVKPVTKSAQADFKRVLGVPAESLVLLVAGGGLGARSLNNRLVEIAPKLLKVHPNLFILHQTGSIHQLEVANGYQSRLDRHSMSRLKIIGFTDEFFKYSGAADLIVTRAGATALAEFAVQAKACIVIPSPYLTGGHQLKNAEILQKQGAVEVLDNDSSAEELQILIDNLLGDPKKRQILSQKFAATARPDAADKLADIILQVAGSGGQS